MRYLTTELHRVFHGVTLRKNRNSVTLWLNVPACIILLTLNIKQVQSQDLIRYVNPIIGTGPATTESAKRHGAGTEEKGQTFPGVGRPFGMTQWTAETRTTETKCVSPYYYNDKIITGFRGSRWMSGSCTQDYGSATIMPFITTHPDTISRNPVSVFSHSNETSTPAYYKVGLETYPVTTELTGTERSGMMRFSFSGEGEAFLLIRVNSDERQGKVWIDMERNEIICKNPVHRIYQGSGKYAGFCGYFVIRADKPFESVSLLKGEQQLVVKFGSVKTLTVKSGSSFTGIDGARLTLDTEIPGWDFDKTRQASEKVWNETLAKVSVRGGQEDDLVRFYTALYHCYQLPRIASDADGSYIGFAQDTLIHKAAGFTYYDDFSMWDTYRALHPLMMILEPERTGDMIRSLVLKAEQGGWMPIFPAWGNYTAAMIGDHVSTMIADAYIKGIRGFDPEKAYIYMRKNAFETPPRDEYVDGKGRRALTSYLKYGYIPLEDSVWDAFHRYEQVSRTLEYAFDDYALSQYAGAIGKKTDFELLKARSSNWKNVFDPETGFVRGRYADGKWISPFDPYSKARFICEGTPFHYTWYVPQDVPGLIKAMGGKKTYLQKLDLFFGEGHYWHGNEPDHQAAFMFAMGGEPEKTREWVQKIVAEEYGTGPGGLSGNEDAGQMSAWLVFAMMGFYPVCPASGNYVMSVPLFDEIDIRIPGRKDFIIRAENRKPGINTVLSIKKNDKPFKDWQFSHNEIINGSKFTFILK